MLHALFKAILISAAQQAHDAGVLQVQIFTAIFFQHSFDGRDGGWLPNAPQTKGRVEPNPGRRVTKRTKHLTHGGFRSLIPKNAEGLGANLWCFIAQQRDQLL